MKARTTQEIEGTSGMQPVGTEHEGQDVHFLLGVIGPNGQPVCEPLDDEAKDSAAYWAGLREKQRRSLRLQADAAAAQAREEEKTLQQVKLSEFERQLTEGL